MKQELITVCIAEIDRGNLGPAMHYLSTLKGEAFNRAKNLFTQADYQRTMRCA